MKPLFCVLALTFFAVANAQFGRTPARGYGAPQAAPAPAPAPQPTYGSESSASSLSEAQHDHQGLDWLLESVPGQPGTDYPIYSQDQLSGFTFECNGNIEGGYYADPNSQCQAFHVCIPDGLGGLGTQSFLCPNGTIFNQEYFICDWWFNFDCSQATGLYSRNDDVRAEAEAASLASASNNRNTYASPQQQPAQNNRNNYASPQQQQPAQNSYGSPQQNQQASYTGRK